MLKLVEYLWVALAFGRMRVAPATLRRISLVVAVACCGADLAQAQSRVSQAALSSMGLEQVWRGQIEMPIEEGRIVSTHLWRNAGEKQTFAELKLPAGVGGFGSRVLRASADRLGADGKPVGIEVAKQEVETQAMRLLRRPSGIAAEVKEVPIVYLVVVTSDGFVQTFNAETGEKLWSNTTGSPRYPAAPASVSNIGVAVAQGPYLVLFDWKTGKQLSKREMKRASTAGVALIENLAFISSLSGQLMAFNLGEAPTLNNWTFQLYGGAVNAPVNSHQPHKLVAFATDNGMVTVISADEKVEPWFNFDARIPLSGPIAFHGNGLYCCDVSGQVTKVALERLGRIDWRLMIGDPLGAPPIVFDKTVYLANEIGNMFAVDDETGIPVWPAPAQRVRTILAATKEKIFCRSLTDRLLAIDATTGKLLGESMPAVIHTDLVNHLDDRVYMISENGQITCFRQEGEAYVLPQFHEPLLPAAETASPGTVETAGQSGATETMEATGESAAVDPFGLGAAPATGAAPAAVDAFGAPAAPATPPAAGGADPFATPPAGGSNPFGTPPAGAPPAGAPAGGDPFANPF